MPKTIAIDKVDLERITLMKDANGEIQVYAEYAMKSGETTLFSKHEFVEVKLSGARRASARQLFDALGQDVSSAELV